MAIQLSKNGNAVKFDFDDNSHYLNDGTIEVPVNSLTLVTDESDMFTFKKAASDDIFISGLYEEIGMSKSELIAWYKDNMVGSTGGGGVTSGEVQTMIDESVSGKADTSDVQNVASDVATVSGDVNTLSGSVNSLTGNVNTLSGDVSTLSGDVANKADTSAVTASINTAVSGKMDTSAFNTYSASTDARLSEDEEVTSAALNELNDALDDKADTSAVTESINAAVSGKADTSAVTASITAAVSGKQDTLIAGSGITIDSANTISCTVEGGGKAIEAGRGIAITTGATADTVSFNLPISAATGENSIFGVNSNTVASKNSFAFGSGNTLNATNANYISNYAIGNGNSCDGNQNLLFGLNNSLVLNNSQNVLIGDSNRSLQYYNAHNCIFGKNNVLGGFRDEYNIVLGNNNTISDNQVNYTTIIGNDDTVKNRYEVATGRFNNSVSGSSTFGDSGNTLFSVGNGTAADARHNAFEIRQNGDIYITSGGTDIKLQDNLGGGGLPESAFTAYTASTEARISEDEEVTAAALNTLNTATAANTTALGGLKLVQLTQAQYDNLATKDASTLYIITGSN